MTEPVFFEIPIYRCTRQEHTDYFQRLEEKTLEQIDKTLYPESYQGLYHHFHKNIWYPWKYNDLMGFLNLYIMGNQFRADEYSITKRRINKGIIKKRFEYKSKVMEKSIPKNKTSNELFLFVLDNLLALNKKEYRNRYLDLSTLKITGRFIDWKLLTSQLNAFTYPQIKKEYLESLK